MRGPFKMVGNCVYAVDCSCLFFFPCLLHKLAMYRYMGGQVCFRIGFRIEGI